MADKITAPYGAWGSPISADMIVQGFVRLSYPHLDGDDIYWVEGRPQENGRNVLMRRRKGREPDEVLPEEFNVRSRVHEYGGRAYDVNHGIVAFVHDFDQQLYVFEPGQRRPRRLTPGGALRYVDPVIDRRNKRIVAVCEDHTAPGQPQNAIVSVPLSGQAMRVLASGRDFYATPRLSPKRDYMLWLEWDHPNMPWDGTELWLARLQTGGTLSDRTRLDGDRHRSIFQPGWSPQGSIYYVSDATGWWNLYEWDGRMGVPVLLMEAEFGLPQWAFGMSTYAFDGPQRIACCWQTPQHSHLGLLNTATQELKPLELPFRSYSSPVANAGKVLFIGEAGRRPAALVQLDLESGEWEVVAESGQLDVPRAQLSCPCPVQFETSGNETAYGYYYPPVNPDYEAPAGELPPLLVKMHGGPTSAASPALSLSIQYWTSRGFAVLDVDYRGSTGYGREYRNRLYHNWGVVDVDDCAAGARKLARDGKVDPDRLAIRGGSAGGFTALAALAFSDVFNAGASYYGVSDLEALARDTHKFESHYLDQLIGPYPQRRDLYEDRSPLGHVDRITAPIIFFQGLEDKIVPPDQSEAMVEALRERGVAVAYLPLAGEQHGFRNAESIKHTLEAELYFYSRVFNFEPADELPKVDIANLD